MRLWIAEAQGVRCRLFGFAILVAILEPCSCSGSHERFILNGDLPEWLLAKLIYEEPNRHLHELGQISDVEGSLVRTFLSPAHMRAASLIRRWMREAGMRTWMDSVGNVHGRVDGANPQAPALLLGSHYDTVVDAGRYDGALGIISAISAVKAALLHAGIASEALGIEALEGTPPDLDLGALLGNRAASLLLTPLEVVAFSDEEGVRFQTTFLGSRAVTGALLREGMMFNKDGSGMTLTEVLQGHGFDASEAAVAAIAMEPAAVRGYVEVHMEQGPILEASGAALGPVAGIAGQTRLAVQVHGVQGHAGTVPMGLRYDPVPAVGEATVAIERRCGGSKWEGGVEEGPEHLVCTVGSILLWPGASNVIAGAANFSIDIRARHDAVRHGAVADIQREIHSICKRRGLRCVLEIKHEAAAVHSDPDIISALQAVIPASQSIMEQVMAEVARQQGNGAVPVPPPGTPDDAPPSGGSEGSQALPLLVSGAGHDALAMAELTKIGMLFVRDRGGISHSPLEFVREPDVAASVAAMYAFILSDVAPPPASTGPASASHTLHEDL